MRAFPIQVVAAGNGSSKALFDTQLIAVNFQPGTQPVEKIFLKWHQSKIKKREPLKI
jgi:hypothetical protein